MVPRTMVWAQKIAIIAATPVDLCKCGEPDGEPHRVLMLNVDIGRTIGTNSPRQDFSAGWRQKLPKEA